MDGKKEASQKHYWNLITMGQVSKHSQPECY